MTKKKTYQRERYQEFKKKKKTKKKKKNKKNTKKKLPKLINDFSKVARYKINI